MVYLTGDTHRDFRRFSMDKFPEQKSMSREDFVIILGDFGGIWDGSSEEKYWLNWLNDKSFTTLFIDGNHENFYALNQFPIVNFNGGKAHKIMDNIYHLKRGWVFDLCGKKFWTFGGASSHDISDGIIDPADYKDPKRLHETLRLWRACGMQFRVKGLSWWEQELPSQEEMDTGLINLEAIQYKPDFILTHCLPQSLASTVSFGLYKPDRLTTYLDNINDLTCGSYCKWYCGHYHVNLSLMNRHIILYEKIERII